MDFPTKKKPTKKKPTKNIYFLKKELMMSEPMLNNGLNRKLKKFNYSNLTRNLEKNFYRIYLMK